MDFTEVMIHVGICVVRPSLTNVQIFNERARISTPKLFCWNQPSWWHNRSSSDLRSIFNFSSFKYNAFISNNYIVSDMARVKSAVWTDRAVSSDMKFSIHTCWKWRSCMQYRVFSDAWKMTDIYSINISSYHSVIPNTCESPQLNLTDNSGARSNPVILCSWLDIVKGQLHSMLRVLLNGCHLVY